ncbi:MAG: DUF4864 domain-containing protein [Actinomycetes bacterium]
MKKRTRLLTLVFALAVSSSLISPSAQGKTIVCSAKQKSLIQRHITGQIDALAKSDWEGAYSFAALSFQKAVPLDLFKETIKSQYVFLVFNDGFGFGSCKVTKSGFNQVATIDYHGVKHVLSYDLSLADKRLGVVAANEVKSSPGLAA